MDAIRTDSTPNGQPQAAPIGSTPQLPTPVIEFRPEGVPQELRDFPHFVGWRYEWRKNNPALGYTKPPYCVRHGKVQEFHAEVDQPQTWATFPEALTAFAAGGLDGLGIMMSLSMGLIGIDLDHATDAAGNLLPWAADILQRLPETYTERSPSGTGLRLFLYGTLPPWFVADGSQGRRRGGRGDGEGALEVYVGLHYLTITGARLPASPVYVAPDDGQLEGVLAEVWPERVKRTQGKETAPRSAIRGALALSNEAILEELFSNENGPKVRALCDGGDLHYKSASEADAALAQHFAWRTGADRTRMTELFKLTRRATRDKLQARPDLIERAVEFAARTNTRTYTGRGEGGGAGAAEGGAGTAEGGAGTAEGGERQEQKAHAARLLTLAEGLTLCRDSMGEGWVDLPSNGGRRTLKLNSGAFRDWLTRSFHQEHGIPPSKEALGGALAVLQSKAAFEGELDDPAPRLAFRDGRLYLDLVDDTGRCVEITPDGWGLTQTPPVRFRRPAGLGALLPPVAGGSLADLRRYLNVSADDLVLVTGWLIACFCPFGGLPILLLHGEQGSAKTFTACLLRDLIDPGRTLIAAPPRDEGTLAIAAENSLICAYDNLSGLSAEMSDAFCRLATGAGFRKRKLYSNDEEAIFTGRRPLLLTGIADVARRSDLLSRSLMVTLPTIPPAHCKPEEDLGREFNAAAPFLLGALLDAVVMALRRRERVVGPFPRLADAARFVTAAEPALGWRDRTFLSVLATHHQEIHETALDGHPVPAVLRKWLSLQAEQTWVGTWDDLRVALDNALPAFKKPREWPETARKLSADLQRLGPNLRAVGVHFERQQRGTGGTRNVKLWVEVPAPLDTCKTPSLPSLRHSPIPHPGNSSEELPQTAPFQPQNTGFGAESPGSPSDGVSDGMSDGVGYRHSHRHSENGGYQQTLGQIPSNYQAQTPSSDGSDGSDGLLPYEGGGRWRAVQEYAGSPPREGAKGSLLSRNALQFDGYARVINEDDEVWLIVRDAHRIPTEFAALPRISEAAPTAVAWLNGEGADLES